MRHTTTLTSMLVLAATAACTARTPTPLECSYLGAVLEEDDEADSPDGCLTYVCSSGELVVADDRRATISGDLALTTQAAVDELSCLGVVEGTLAISGTAADLTPLASLYRVGGGLEITAGEAVTLAGLDGITEVNGAIVIADNPGLTTLSFHPSLTALGNLTIQNNDALASLAGAEFIGQCTSCIEVSGEPKDLVGGQPEARDAAPAGDGFEQPSGGTFYGEILIADNDVLSSVQAMSNLYYAWSNVRFRNNAVLTSLVGLQLFEVRGDLEISDHASMDTLDAETFAAGVSVLGTTTVCGNANGVACP